MGDPDRLAEALARPGIRARQEAYRDRMIVTRSKLEEMLQAMREGAVKSSFFKNAR